VEEVYHCAAKVSFHPKDEKEMYHTNVKGTENLLYACSGSGVKKFLHVSSIAVLDNFNEKGELDEILILILKKNILLMQFQNTFPKWKSGELLQKD
jgi:nucleoside-diphosphate-sugar epimerase